LLMRSKINELKEDFEDLKIKANTDLSQAQNINSLKDSYRNARRTYKSAELFIGYYFPKVEKLLNGPLVITPKFDVREHMVYPEGFQVMEEIIFSDKKIHKEKLLKNILKIQGVVHTLLNSAGSAEVSESQIFEMLKLELIRIVSLHINGFDATFNKENIQETIYCLEGIKQVMILFNLTIKEKTIEEQYYTTLRNIDQTIKHLVSHKKFDTFDRIQFISKYINPLSSNITDFQNGLKVEYQSFNFAYRFRSPTIFAKDAINSQYFTQKVYDTVNNKMQAELGKILFFDPVLSGNGKRACASCHNPDMAFTDGKPKSAAFNSEGHVKRNAPTVINAVLQKALFYDGRVMFLEDQISEVLMNKDELHGNFSDATNTLEKSVEYRKLFKKAFKGSRDTIINEHGIKKAIAEYEKTLVALNSRFDKYMRGDSRQISKEEIKGYNLFAGKALCGTCHFLPLFNGVLPPSFVHQEFEILGVPENLDNKKLDDDIGRAGITGVPLTSYSFKTPTLRNVELTAPYMHNGVYNTLDEVVNFYNKGGGKGLGFSIPHQTLPSDSLGLTMNEMKSIVAFLKTLTDTVGTTSKPLRLPYFENEPELNKRKVGGDY
ncbi:MAG: cytochrome-c peroxidase, partial [Bacteroidota bacterium]